MARPAFDDPGGRSSGVSHGVSAVVVRLAQQEPVEHESLEVATGDAARGETRRLLELLRHQAQDHLQLLSPQARGHAEVEARRRTERSPEQSFQLRLQASPRDHQAELDTVR